MTEYKIDHADVAGVLAELDGEWTVAGNYGHYASATRADGMELGFHHEYNMPAGKVEVSLTVPHEHKRYDETTPRVRVTLTRGAATVARDLARRFMPDAEEMHAAMVERVAASDAYAGRVAAHMDALTSVAGVTARNAGARYPSPNDDNRASVRIGDVYGDVSVSGDGTARVELGGVPVSVLITLLAQLADLQVSA